MFVSGGGEEMSSLVFRKLNTYVKIIVSVPGNHTDITQMKESKQIFILLCIIKRFVFVYLIRKLWTHY